LESRRSRDPRRESNASGLPPVTIRTCGLAPATDLLFASAGLAISATPRPQLLLRVLSDPNAPHPVRSTENSSSTADSTAPGASSQQDERGDGRQRHRDARTSAPSPLRHTVAGRSAVNRPPGATETEPAFAAGSDAPSPDDPRAPASERQSPFPRSRSPHLPQCRFAIASAYRVLGEHGRAAWAACRVRHDIELGRDVAIKELIARNHIGEVRFLREALNHLPPRAPGIVPVHEAGRWPDGTPFYAMKLVSGRPLRELIAERKRPSTNASVCSTTSSLWPTPWPTPRPERIHSRPQAVQRHRRNFGETVVIDWGLAKDITAPEDSATQQRVRPCLARRRPHLCWRHSRHAGLHAPEAGPRRVGLIRRADVFAIGAMLWELCSLERSRRYSGQRTRILRRSGVEQDLATIIHKASIRVRTVGILMLKP